jgi:hypothetical protein
MEDVEAFFAPHGDVLCVRLRRIAATKAFKVAPPPSNPSGDA